MITVTDAAAKRFGKMLERQPNSLGIRLGIKNSGCAQYSYLVDFAKESESDDVIFEQHNVKFFINTNALNILNGTVVDYVSKGISKILVFKNPNAVNECGCGESFSVKDNQEE